MLDFVVILFSSVLVNNYVLVQTLGGSSLMRVSNNSWAVASIAAATVATSTLTAIIAYCLDQTVLLPFDLMYLRTFTFICVIACTVQAIKLWVKHFTPVHSSKLRVFLPLLAGNCVVLSVALYNARSDTSLLQALLSGFGAGASYTIVLICFTFMRERLDAADIPQPFKGGAVAMLTAGLMSIAFMGLSGLV